MIAVADTGYIVALKSKSDKHHARCAAVYKRYRTIYVPQTTLTEVCYILARDWGHQVAAQFVLDLPHPRYKIIPLEPEDIYRTGQLMMQYTDMRLDFVDSTVIAVAERLLISTILTIDQRDFRVVRPKHIEYFEIEPS